MRTVDHHWTVDQVKSELPCVSVLHKGRHFIGRVFGRLNQFATVDIRPTDSERMTAEFSWEAITRAKNRERSLSM